ncbi:MAG: hypothetical protein KC486_29855 [Myxococcales bacterium]|nr:hypothetical protein [Myxococcales bacterium]
MMRRPLSLAALSLVAVAAAGCQQRTSIVIPNRVLDRPLDLDLACVQTDGEVMTPLSVNQCASTVSDCGSRDTPQLLGLIANSERNEVALFAKCLGGLVDMDREAPGYQFVPVGELPSSVSVSADGCRGAVANYGSCDISVLDVPALAADAVEVDIGGSPSSRVATVSPRRADGTPLAARPGHILIAPDDLSNSTAVGDGLGFGDVTDGICLPDQPKSAYVTFPGCDLIAEIDLLSGRILQSRQLLVAADGGIDVVDTGSDPLCPLECADQLTDTEIADLPDVPDVGDRVAPQALALVVPPEPDDDGLPVDPADEAILGSTLFVGGAGSDTLIELPFEGRVFSDTSLELELSAASGILGIRPTPAMELVADAGTLGVYHQFLYIIAGDGSTRVVRRNLEESRDEIGTECDTQVDPTQVTTTICNEAAYPGDNPPDRRPFAQGPGIRAPNGAVITDWTFQRVDAQVDEQIARSPFTTDGVVGIGVTNVGRVVFVTFGQFSDGVQIPQTLDPLETINAQIFPHSLWPVIDPGSGDPQALPRVQDREPSRYVGGETTESNAVKVLAPSLRRIDLAYVDPCTLEDDADSCASASSLLTGASSSPITNADGLGNTSESAIYSTEAVRVVSRDYREWRAGEWNLYWEGEIPGTSSATGQLQCDAATSDSGVYCYAEEAGDSRLIDTAASFCDDGVLPGDKLLLFGCTDTNDCGIGQICLRSQGSNSTGICVSGEAFDQGEDRLRQECAEYISDPCGSPLREFQVSRAYQTELWLQEMDLAKSAYILESTDEESGETTITEYEGRLLCAEDQPEGGCSTNFDCEGIEGLDRNGETVEFPLCIDGLCRRACDEETEDCILRRLPGPRCFGELLRYQVRARNSFVVRGPGSYSFLSQQVRADEDGECYHDPSVSNLLTSRIRLGEDLADTKGHAIWPIPECPGSGDIPSTGTPNPCFVTGDRPASLDANDIERLFHNMFYAGQRVEAIRYSNPMFSVELDLVSLLGLASALPGQSTPWPAEFAEFRRSRIPRNYRETFSTLSGYQPYNEGANIGSVTLVGPVRVIDGPQAGIVYVVDASGSGGVGGLRGQVMRVTLTPNVVVDENFIVR